jgi:Xaa-Pro dipeptidase
VPEQLSIPDAELVDRRSRLLAAYEGSADAAVLFGSASIFYLSGFSFIPTERPIALICADRQAVAFVPALEKEHVEAWSSVDQVETYEEYPGEEPPMVVLARAVKAILGRRPASLLVDGDGYPSRYGYHGPKLSEVLPGTTQLSCSELLEGLRRHKSPQELHLLQESSRWADVAHGHLQRGCHDGANETEVSVAASLAATQEMLATLGDHYDPRSSEMLSVHAGFRSQIGPNAALPHAIPRHLTMRVGDVLVTGASAAVWGYRCELERTMFIGEPSAEQRRFFSLMLGAQETARSHLRAGLTCSDVDRAVRSYYAEHGIERYWRHHTGHGLGMEVHESPFLDVGDTTPLEPGMVFSLEPGIYVAGLGGFRHSDTAVVTEEGGEYMTAYPRELEDLICEP